MVQQYLQQVGVAVVSQGKPTSGDFIEVMTARVQKAIKEIVPNNYRLAVRMAVRKYVKQLNKAAKGI